MRTLLRRAPLTLALLACAGESSPAAKETPAPSLPPAEATLAVDGGNIWYRVSGTGTGTPVILLHGGPGYGSFYLKPLEELGDNRPVVRFDQLGNRKAVDTSPFGGGK